MNTAPATDQSLRIFCAQLSFAKHLNAARMVSLYDFSQLSEHGAFRDVESVCVVSGTESEPELNFLDARTEFLSYPEFDLDDDWSEIPSRRKQFDFVLCNQVLEHIYSPCKALENLSGLVRPGGLIYLSLPTLNRIHGEPYFFSSGYHPRFVSRLAIDSDLEIVHQGWRGNRLYVTAAVAGKWLTMDSLLRLEKYLPDSWTAWQTQHSDGPAAWIADTWALLRVPKP